MKYTNKYNLPISICKAIENDPYDAPKNKQNVISASGLNSTPRERQLYIRHYDKLVEDVSENIWRLFGSSVHAMLDRIKIEGIVTEERTEKTVGNMIVTGKPDALIKNDIIKINAKKGIDDYKITSVWTIIHMSQIESWTKQLNIYDWLFSIQGKLQVIALLRDWQTSKAKYDNSGNYPKIPVSIVNIPLWTPEKQLEYIEERIQLHTEVVSMSDEELPLCSPEERWQNETTYAVMKRGAKRALKVCNTLPEAEQYLSCYKDPSVCEVVMREGQDNKCVGYCGVNKFCDYWIEKYAKSSEVF